MTSTTLERKSWTAAGADVAMRNTYASIQKALAGIESKYGAEIFLQGSYANHTNIRNDSDVDIVVMSTFSFQGSAERLGPIAKARYAALSPAPFTVRDLRAEVTAALSSYYGESRVDPRNKCIRVLKKPGYVDADIVPCIEYHWYPSPDSDIYSDYVEGVTIHPRDGGRIINFPKEHLSNGQTKNGLCHDRYKATVRQIKRLRNRAVSEGRLADNVAPGYLLECMTYNVPPSAFVYDDSERLSKVVLWLMYADKTSFWSADGIHHLFYDDPGNFDIDTAQMIIDALWEAY